MANAKPVSGTDSGSPAPATEIKSVPVADAAKAVAPVISDKEAAALAAVAKSAAAEGKVAFVTGNAVRVDH